MRARLNKTTVDEAVYQGQGGCYLWDTVMHGFGLLGCSPEIGPL